MRSMYLCPPRLYGLVPGRSGTYFFFRMLHNVDGYVTIEANRRQIGVGEIDAAAAADIASV